MGCSLVLCQVFIKIAKTKNCAGLVTLVGMPQVRGPSFAKNVLKDTFARSVSFAFCVLLDEYLKRLSRLKQVKSKIFIAKKIVNLKKHLKILTNKPLSNKVLKQ